MRKSAILIFLATVLSAQVAAQQVPVYGQYFVNPFLYNPAVAGTGDGARAYSVFRKQWVGIPGSPETQTLTLDGPANNNRMGLGLTLYNDMNNIMTRQGGMGTYAYHIPLATDHTLSVGLSLGFSRTTIAFDKLRAEDPFDQVILSSFDNGMAVDGNAGFSYRYKNLRIGGSALQLFQNNAIFSNDMGNQSLAYKFIRHYTASVQYKFELSPEIFELEPLVLIKSAQGLPSQVDINLIGTYRKNYWAAITHRLNASMAFALGMLVNNRITVGYSYELATTRFANQNNGSHEIILGFKFVRPTPSAESSSPYNDLARQQQEQYELVDQMKQRNDDLAKDLQTQKQTVQKQNEEIARLREEITKNRTEIDSIIRVSKVDVRTENFESSTGKYYTIVGAVKTLRAAKEFQQVLRRESGLETSVIQKYNGSYYFLYTKQVLSRQEALQELNRLQNVKLDVVVGDPWVYKHR